MPSHTSRARLRALETRALAAGLRHSFCRPVAHRGSLSQEEYCARTSIRPADSSGPQACRCRLLPELLRTRLAWESLDRAGPRVAFQSTPRCRLRRVAIARPLLSVPENS